MLKGKIPQTMITSIAYKLVPLNIEELAKVVEDIEADMSKYILNKHTKTIQNAFKEIPQIFKIIGYHSVPIKDINNRNIYNSLNIQAPRLLDKDNIPKNFLDIIKEYPRLQEYKDLILNIDSYTKERGANIRLVERLLLEINSYSRLRKEFPEAYEIAEAILNPGTSNSTNLRVSIDTIRGFMSK